MKFGRNDDGPYDDTSYRRRSRARREETRNARHECWRCGKFVDVDRSRCPFCRATPRSRRTESRGQRPSTGNHSVRSIQALIWSYGFLLAISIFHGWYLHSGPGLPAGPRQEQEKALLQQMMIAEAVEGFVVIFAIFWVTAPRPIKRSSPTRFAAWSLGFPVLALLLGINLLYGKVLQEILGRQPHLEVIMVNLKTHFWLALFSICVVPAVLEEVFFRYLALGKLRSIMNERAAVWVSAVMFGFAHIHNPLGVPVLIVVGAGLGYMRLMSGGLTLPMLIHGLHNAFILALEGNV